MELQHIPKTFWHSLSIAVVVVSTGLTYIAYHSSNVSIELANAKINLSSEVASSTVALSAALEEAKQSKIEAETKYQTLLAQHEILKRQVSSLEERAKTDPDSEKDLEKLKVDCPECISLKPLPKTLPFKTFDKNISKAQQSLNKLEALGKKIQPLR